MSTPQPDAGSGGYGISVAAGLVGVGVQTLRLYEKRGLLEPVRSDGGTRRYSDADVATARRVNALLDDGLNLAGIVLVLALEKANATLRADNARLRGAARRA